MQETPPSGALAGVRQTHMLAIMGPEPVQHYHIGDDDDDKESEERRDWIALDLPGASGSVARSMLGLFSRDAESSSSLLQSSSSKSWFPWWQVDQPQRKNDYMLVKMQGRTGEGLLVDPGSPDNLVGEAFSLRQAALARAAGAGETEHRSMEALTVGGVGKEAQTCRHKVTLPVALDRGERGGYEAPEIPDSEVPALLGMRSLDAMGAVIDCRNGRLYRVGPGGYQIRLSPGSRVNHLERASTGHLLLPCSEFMLQPDGAAKSTFYDMEVAPASE